MIITTTIIIMIYGMIVIATFLRLSCNAQTDERLSPSWHAALGEDYEYRNNYSSVSTSACTGIRSSFVTFREVFCFVCVVIVAFSIITNALYVGEAVRRQLLLCRTTR
jgi:hypothetical protein